MSHITQEQILNFAKESGFKFKNFNPPIIAVQHSNGSWISVSDELTAFANLVVAALAQPIKEIVVNADYREMWAQQVQMNQQLTAALAQPEPVVLIGKVESAAVACRGFHVVLAEGATMPKIGDLILTAAKKPAKGGAL